MSTQSSAAPTLFRAPGSTIEHFAHVDSSGAWVTACGKSAKSGARFTSAERGMDAKIRPLCATCRAAR